MKSAIASATAIAFVLFTPSIAVAEAEARSIERRIETLRLERAKIDVRTPQGWRIAGGIVGGAGLSLAAGAGIACATASSGSGTRCRSDTAGVIAGVGGGIAALGLAAFLGGNSVLSRRREEVREIDEEIMNLRRQESRRTPRIRVAWGLSIGEVNGVSFAIRY